MHKKHQKPEFEVISIDKENARFFVASRTLMFFVPTTNMDPLGTPPSAATTSSEADDGRITKMYDGGTIDFN